MKNLLFLLLVALGSFTADAQKDTLALKSIQGITDKMIELISVEIGEEPDWDEYRDLFVPRATKTTLRPDGKPGRQLRTYNIEEFIRNVGPLYGRDGFHEEAIGLKVFEYNGLATAFQSYNSKNLKGTYEARGINCYQLVFADNRWWIVSTAFVGESETDKIPQFFQKIDQSEK